MKAYDFTLKFRFNDPQQDGACYLEPLAEAGCDDALIGIGQRGRISLNFIREAETEQAAIASAMQAIQGTIPDLTLLATSSLTDSTEQKVDNTTWYNLHRRHQTPYDAPSIEHTGFARAAHYG